MTENDPACRAHRCGIYASKWTVPAARLELLHGLSFDVHPRGRQSPSSGESGAGKSLAMMAILGLLSQPPFRVDVGTGHC